ncbi:MAG: S24/S26 family peptidase [Clostridia bacterium]|nr:S24/S26 family peptidase [Clostridia bacterium]
MTQEPNSGSPTAERVRLASMDDLMPLIRERLAAGQSVKLSPRGVSMRPMLREGLDSVTLSQPPTRLKKYDIPLYLREDGTYVLHRVVRVGETYTCIGDNQFVKEHGIPHERVIAVVTAFTRGGKSRSVGAISYRIYCRFWHFTRFPRRAYRGVIRRVRRLFRK